MINSYRINGAKVVVVVMPGSSVWRSMTPPEALLALNRATQCIPQGPSTVLIDLWEFLPDEEFNDVIHPNAAGREHITKRVIEAIAPFVEESRGSHVLRP
jgi:hypothetical protein